MFSLAASYDYYLIVSLLTSSTIFFNWLPGLSPPFSVPDPTDWSLADLVKMSPIRKLNSGLK